MAEKSTKKYRVRGTRPSGEKFWLGQAGAGACYDPDQSPLVSLEEAAQDAYDRNRFYGKDGWKYEVVAEEDCRSEK